MNDLLLSQSLNYPSYTVAFKFPLACFTFNVPYLYFPLYIFPEATFILLTLWFLSSNKQYLLYLLYTQTNMHNSTNVSFSLLPVPRDWLICVTKSNIKTPFATFSLKFGQRHILAWACLENASLPKLQEKPLVI